MKNIWTKIKKRKGFVILLAVTISSILLSIALGVANIVLKEIRFGTTARAGNDAFFAADTGIECALYSDKPPTVFTGNAKASSVSCASDPTNTTYSQDGSGRRYYSFFVVGLGSRSSSCAKVTVMKDSVTSPPYTLTSITSKGYDIGDSSCNSTSTDRVEREVKVNY